MESIVKIDENTLEGTFKRKYDKRALIKRKEMLERELSEINSLLERFNK